MSTHRARPLSLTASGIPASFDWNAEGPKIGNLPYSQFTSRVAAALAQGDETAGLATGSKITESDLAAALTGWRVVGTWQTRWDVTYVAESADGRSVLLAVAEPDDRSVRVSVYSPDGHPAAAAAVDRVMSALADYTGPDADDIVAIRFWSYHPMYGATSYVRDIDAPDWSDVAANYPADARDALAALHGWTAGPPTGAGKLLLTYGAAGTGKTTFARTLARAWGDWCSVEYVIDPNEFFGHADYMTSVVLGDADDGRWRLLIVEDSDELLTADAKKRSGQNVSRLLNLCDGVLGQGLRTMLYLTTNEEVADNIHPAIVRPGRCAASIEVGRFAGPDADVWRVAHDLPETGVDASLAELYAEARSVRPAIQAQRAARVRDVLSRAGVTGPAR